MADDSPWLTPRQQQIWRAWMSMQDRLPTALNRQLASSSALSQSDYAVLVCLSEADEGRLRVTDLAARIGWERSRLSHQLRRMAERGLLARQDCPEDGRVSYAGITASGLEAIRSSAPGHARAVRSLVFEGADEDELAAVVRFLTRAEARVAAASG